MYCWAHVPLLQSEEDFLLLCVSHTGPIWFGFGFGYDDVANVTQYDIMHGKEPRIKRMERYNVNVFT